MSARPQTADDLRKRELAAIHVSKAQLGLGDDEYRDLLFAVARVRSASELDWTGRKRVLDHMKKLRRAMGKPDRGGDGQVRHIRFLWHRLHELGAVANDSTPALQTFVKRQTGKSALQWLSTAEARSVIEGMKQWVARAEKAAAEVA